MGNVPITVIDEEDIDRSQYWVIRVSGIEWSFVIFKLIQRYKLDQKAPTDRAIITSVDNQLPVYMLHKRFIPASAIVRATGLSLDQIEALDMIKLSTQKREVQEPTVGYWGEA